jgi:hypothetical protein
MLFGDSLAGALSKEDAMLRKASSLFGYRLSTRDDQEMGSVHDFFFDRQDWHVRYLVADIGSWFSGRQVLIATSALGIPEWEAELLRVNLSKEEVKASPDIDLDAPVTRQHEADLVSHYGWPNYWVAPMAVAGAGIAPLAVAPAPAARLPEEVVTALQNTEESHLHSMRDSQGYAVEATDGGIGQVSDFFVDDHGWAIRYLLIDTGNWLPGKKVLLAPQWVDSIDWHEGRLYVNHSKSEVEHSPEYNPSGPLERVYERELHRHYGYPEYW